MSDSDGLYDEGAPASESERECARCGGVMEDGDVDECAYCASLEACDGCGMEEVSEELDDGLCWRCQEDEEDDEDIDEEFEPIDSYDED
jgi:hypothetical protein